MQEEGCLEWNHKDIKPGVALKWTGGDFANRDNTKLKSMSNCTKIYSKESKTAS